jgi:hypothetical protein
MGQLVPLRLGSNLGKVETRHHQMSLQMQSVLGGGPVQVEPS